MSLESLRDLWREYYSELSWQGSLWPRTNLSHHFNLLYYSQVLHRHVWSRCHTLCTWLQMSRSNACVHRLDSWGVWSLFCRTVMLQSAVRTPANKPWERSLLSWKRVRGMQREVEGGETDLANLLKGSYFHGDLVWQSITWRPRPLILLRPLTLNLISTDPYR